MKNQDLYTGIVAPGTDKERRNEEFVPKQQ